MHSNRSARALAPQRLALLVGVLALGFLCATEAIAAPVTLQNGNSVLVVDPYSQDGVKDWIVDGRDYLAKQWFWYRIGPDGPERSIDTIDPNPVVYPSDGDGDGLNDHVLLTYTNPNNMYKVKVALSLTGGGSVVSNISDTVETIRIENTSPIALDLHFFQYADFDLSRDGASDTIQFPAPNTAHQTNNAIALTETIVAPQPNHLEGNTVPATLDRLNDSLPTTLNDNAGPLNGNVNWAFQWDINLAPRSTFLIGKDKQLIVPEPSSVVLCSLGLLALMACRRLRKR